MPQKLLSTIYILTGLIFSIVFYESMVFSEDPSAYFKPEFYWQFGKLVLGIELIIAGIHLFQGHKKTNFTMALFGFTAVLDPVFNYFGILSSNVPLYGSIVFIGFAIVSFYIAFTNAYNSGKISIKNVVFSFLLGLIIELFFNYLWDNPSLIS